MSTTVSIIIPIYNGEKYISKCLDSILNQSYQEIEIICIDDCSTDSSMDIVEKYRLEAPNKITVVHNQENRGASGSRDVGICTATGDYVAFVDADDYVAQDYIEQYIQAAEDETVDLIIGGYYYFKEKKSKKIQPRDTYEDKWIFCSSCCKLYKRSFLITNGINFRGVKRYEDEQFCSRVMLNNPKTKVINYAGYYYVYNADSFTQNVKLDRTQIFLDYVKITQDFYYEISRIDIEKHKDIFEYCLISRLIANLLYNGRGCGVKRMQDLYHNMDSLLKKIGRKNRYITFFPKINAEDFKIHYCTWLVMFFRKIGIDNLLFWIDSYL